MSGVIIWNEKPVVFSSGQSVAAALNAAGIAEFGNTSTGLKAFVFCGIGQCQNCLVQVDKKGATEACLLPCLDGMRLSPASCWSAARE